MSTSRVVKPRSRPQSASRIPTSPVSSPISSTDAEISSPISSSPASTQSQASQKKLKQSLLAIGLNQRKTCIECGMSYLKNLRSDIKQHEKYHERCLNGRDWNQHWGDEVMRFNNNEYIVRVNPAKQAEVNTALELLEVVNKDLNAPDDNEFWLSTQDKGFVYLYVKNKVAVGLVSIIRITQGKWFSIEDGKIVSDKNMNLLAGISRIYVCTNYRRQGIGLKLLQSVQESLVYGMTVPKLLIGWSQPSTSGAKLASAFNSVHHKSGKTLVPVYIE